MKVGDLVFFSWEIFEKEILNYQCSIGGHNTQIIPYHFFLMTYGEENVRIFREDFPNLFGIVTKLEKDKKYINIYFLQLKNEIKCFKRYLVKR